MTKDRDFKRIVRARAAESGERYTDALAALRTPETSEEDHVWYAVRTRPGAEEWIQAWLLQRFPRQIADLIIPRYGGERFAPGLLLLRLQIGEDPTTILGGAWFIDRVGVRGSLCPLSWQDVRELLKKEAATLRRHPGRATASSFWPRRTSLAPSTPVEIARRAALFDLVARAERTDPDSDSDSDSDSAAPGPTGSSDLADLAGPGDTLAGVSLDQAVTELVEAHRYLVDVMVCHFAGRSDAPAADLEAAGLAGLEGAVRRRARTGSEHPFEVYAAWWVRQAIIRRLRRLA